MEYFLEGSAPLRIWYVNSEENICTCYSSHIRLLYQHTNVLQNQYILCLGRDQPSNK